MPSTSAAVVAAFPTSVPATPVARQQEDDELSAMSFSFHDAAQASWCVPESEWIDGGAGYMAAAHGELFENSGRTATTTGANRLVLSCRTCNNFWSVC